ncbi:MAG: metallophosphoesterase family protein, partial [Thermoleophilia bacterium]
EALRRRLLAQLEVGVGGNTVAITHDAGPAKGRLPRLRRRFPSADAVVFGHSHLPLHETDDGFQIFNPGSPTERRRAPRPSMGLLESTAPGLVFEHVWL